MDMPTAMGIELLTEGYRALQKFENFEMKTSSWVQTPANIRELGGALFLRLALRESLCVSQRCILLLRGQSVPLLSKGLNFTSRATFQSVFSMKL